MYSNTVLIGNVGDVKAADNYTLLKIATDERWKDRDSGEWQKRTTWHSVFFRGYLREKAAKCSKGDTVMVEGCYRNSTKEEKKYEMALSGNKLIQFKPKDEEKKQATTGDEDDLPF